MFPRLRAPNGVRSPERVTKKVPTKVETLDVTSGGDEGNRTPDLLTASQALSQLSYAPKQQKELYGNVFERASTFLPIRLIFCRVAEYPVDFHGNEVEDGVAWLSVGEDVGQCLGGFNIAIVHGLYRC